MTKKNIGTLDWWNIGLLKAHHASVILRDIHQS